MDSVKRAGTGIRIRAVSFPFRHDRLLQRTEYALRRSDPHLAGMLTIFSEISAREKMPSQECMHTAMSWLTRRVAWALALITILATRLICACDSVLLRAAKACVGALTRTLEPPHSIGDAAMARSDGACAADDRRATLFLAALSRGVDVELLAVWWGGGWGLAGGGWGQ